MPPILEQGPDPERAMQKLTDGDLSSRQDDLGHTSIRQLAHELSSPNFIEPRTAYDLTDRLQRFFAVKTSVVYLHMQRG
jgi:hypothetical protein